MSAVNAHVIRASRSPLRAVVEQRSSRLDLGRRVGEVVGQRLVAVGATVGRQVADRLADHALGELDDVGSSVKVRSGHRKGTGTAGRLATRSVVAV